MTFEYLTPGEMLAALALLPDAVIAQLKREDVVLAGGLLRDVVTGLPVKDVDVFCHSKEQAERLAIEASAAGRHTVRHTLFAYSVALDVDGVSIPVQYVFYKEFADAKELVSQFDFRACCAGLYWSAIGTWAGVAVEGFHDDCRHRVLLFMSQSKDAGKLTALGRALHLASKGWRLSTAEAAKIVSHFEPTLTPERLTFAFRPGYGGPR